MERIGLRVVGGQADIMVGLCDGEEIVLVEMVDPVNHLAGDDDDIPWWTIERRGPDPEPAEGQSEQVITVGEVPEGFEETVALRGPVPSPPPAVGGTVRMQTGTRADFFFDEEAFDTGGRWRMQEGNRVLTTEELRAARTRVCPETAGQ
jgi:hypothetical protein